jgi:NADP-dependent alcohol dehydrogenase
MLNFEIITPTRIVFGKDQLGRLPELLNTIAPNRKVMLAFGGGSIRKNGTLDALLNALADFHVVQFSGIEPNPEFLTLMKGVELFKKEQLDCILAVGGGSVIDGVKFMTGAIKYAGDPWDVLEKKDGCLFEDAVPFGAVLTLPATGSEANSGAVISRSEWKQKRAMGGPLFFPKFAFCDPTVVATLPERQLANGVVDAFMHTLEQYITVPTGNKLQERQAEAILLTLKEVGPLVMKDPSNYELAANLMWSATHALLGFLRCGVPTDWTTHMIGHELTALYGIDHARTLAIIAPRLYENQFENKKAKLVQYGKRVWELTGTEDEIAYLAIAKTEAFFHQLGIPTHISSYTESGDEAPEIIRNRFIERGWTAMGERQAITTDDVFAIVEKAR